MGKIILALLLGVAVTSWSMQALAAGAIEGRMDLQSYEPAVPQKALVSPAGARLEVEQTAKVYHVNGKSVVEFTLPPDSTNLDLAVQGHPISRWSSTPALLNPDSKTAGRRAKVEKEQVEVNARLMTINARLALWQAPPKTASAQDMEQLQLAMQEEMPRLALEQAQLQRRLKLINEELSRLPQGSGVGERVRVVLGVNLREGEEVKLVYTYFHDACGWEAIYDFDARPEEGSGDEIDVRLLAEVWQFTGMDWSDTHITLATQGFGPREPRPLPDWVVDSQAKAAPAMLSAARSAPNGARAVATMEADNTPVAANVDSVYASWALEETGLPQGRSRLQITKAAWKAPLRWLARPVQGNTKVWLMAKYDLPATQAWPAGLATYSVDGQPVGNGQFHPKSGEATLYFGPDPRVTIQTAVDSRKRGESGIINTSKNWTWAWTYTITNQHKNPVQVIVQRPLPIVVDEEVNVSFKNDPAAVEDKKEHMQVWTVEVPADGKKEIHHSVTISSPTKLPLLPDVP